MQIVEQQAVHHILTRTPEARSTMTVPRSILEAKQKRIHALVHRLHEYCDDDEERFSFLMNAIIMSPEPFKTLEAVAGRAEEGTLVVKDTATLSSLLDERLPKPYNRRQRRLLARTHKRRKP